MSGSEQGAEAPTPSPETPPQPPAATPSPSGVPPGRASAVLPASVTVPESVSRVASRVAMAILRFFEGLVAGIFAIPLIVIAAIARSTWPWYSSVWPHAHEFDNAFIAIAGVGGVLWSGAIISYTVHRRYTPQLRTAVQLIQFAFLAALIALTAQGAVLRSAFYLLAYFYGASAIAAAIVRRVKPQLDHLLTIKPPSETDAAAQARQRLQQSAVDFLDRVAHGAWYFVVVAALCLTTVVIAQQDLIAWSCIAVIIMSLFLILPELFASVEDDAKPR